MVEDAKLAASLINARAETVSEKPTFRSAFKSRRCLVPSSGFFEWQATAAKHKQPFHFRHLDGALLGFAGLWERWKNTDGNPVETCAILTTMANDVVRPVHERMPVILDPADYDRWLNPQTSAGPSGAAAPVPHRGDGGDPGIQLRQQRPQPGAAVPSTRGTCTLSSFSLLSRRSERRKDRAVDTMALPRTIAVIHSDLLAAR